MALLFFDGFESGSVSSRPEWVAGSIQVTTSPVRSGSYIGTMTASSGCQLALPAMAQVVCGFAFQTQSLATLTVFSVYGDANATQHLSIVWNVSTGLLELRRGATAGTLLATATGGAIAPSAWRHIQVKATINDTTGMCQVRVDGVTVIDYVGDTKNAGTSTNIDALRFLMLNGNFYIDDLWVCDGVDGTAAQGRANNDWLGDLKVAGLLPTAAGDTTQFTPSTGANWSCVDDPTLNTTDFVTSSAMDQRDLYQLADLPAGAQSVFAVRLSSYAQKSDAGLIGLKHVVKENAVATVDASPVALSTTFVALTAPTLYRKPSNSTAWTVADVNGMQAGFDVVAM